MFEGAGVESTQVRRGAPWQSAGENGARSSGDSNQRCPNSIQPRQSGLKRFCEHWRTPEETRSSERLRADNGMRREKDALIIDKELAARDAPRGARRARPPFLVRIVTIPTDPPYRRTRAAQPPFLVTMVNNCPRALFLNIQFHNSVFACREQNRICQCPARHNTVHLSDRLRGHSTLLQNNKYEDPHAHRKNSGTLLVDDMFDRPAPDA